MDAALSSSDLAVSVLIVDDHPLVREGLERVMSDAPGVRVVAAVESIEAALEAPTVTGTPIDVITLDLSLPGVAGVEAIDVLRAQWPDARVLVLTVHPEATHAAACAQHGAAGFLSKNAAPAEIRAAVATLAAGGQHFSSTALDTAARHHDGVRVSPREMEVLRAVAAGQRITDIAAMLGVSVKTASTHKMRVQRKLGASNTAQMVVIARNHGLIA